MSLHYVDSRHITILRSTDHIFKDYDVCVDGVRYAPHNFIRILRNTCDGAEGTPITADNSKIIETAMQTLRLESYFAKKGGNKKGFIKSKKKLDQGAIDRLKEGFAQMYSNDSDNVVVLSDGLDFQETSSTSVEMQLNENKKTNANEFAKLFHVPVDTMEGKTKDMAALAKLAAIPLMTTIQCALNASLLLEKEKGSHYWAFDTKELLKGDIKERYEAYKLALDANFMQVDEVRFAEDLAPLGLNWIKLGLQDVLYDPKTKVIYKGSGSSAATGALSTTTSMTAASATAVTADELITLQAKVKQRYQRNACWTMHPDTFTAIKKLKDGQNRYLLQDDFSGEFPYRLLGKPVYLSDNMPAMAASSKAILYGDYSGLSVNIREDISIEVLREKYATQHAIGVVGWFEFDAKVSDNRRLATLVMKSA